MTSPSRRPQADGYIGGTDIIHVGAPGRVGHTPTATAQKTLPARLDMAMLVTRS